ncbi:MAG: hypothetical protein OXI87_08080 [Albidovulum sp.]|nr:hypothetical protein [Albidovulum sp.]MDE0534608.1 hypothetical protein [Albidovulum sp.]
MGDLSGTWDENACSVAVFEPGLPGAAATSAKSVGAGSNDAPILQKEEFNRDFGNLQKLVA